MNTKIILMIGSVLLLGQIAPAADPAGDDAESLRQEVIRLREQLAERDAEIARLKKKLDELEKTRPVTARPDEAVNVSYPPEWVTSFHLAEKNREAEIRKINTKIKDNEQKLTDTKIQHTITEAFLIQENIKLEKKRKELKLAEVPPLPTLDKLTVGCAGGILKGRIQVLHVVGGTEVRAKFLTREGGKDGDKDIAERWSRPVLFRGVETAAFAAGESGKLPGIFIICKPETYTAGGAKKTEFVLEPIDGTAWKNAYLRWKKENSGKDKAKK